MSELEFADTVLIDEGEAPTFSTPPDWDALLPKMYRGDEAATLLIAKRGTIKPSDPVDASYADIDRSETTRFDPKRGASLTPHSVRLGTEQLDLPRHTTTSSGELADFEIVSMLGQGGMGVVHLARQQALRRDVAIKQINPERLSRFAIESLLREAYITGRLEHPNIVPVYLLGVDEQETPLFVMKRIEGVSWQDALEDVTRLPRSYAQFDDALERHLEIIEQVCFGVHYAHSKGVVHRDLKPENVMLGDFGEVYVVDWGIAVSLNEEEGGVLPLARDATEVVGTPMYMAPEQASGEGALLGPHTDVYGLGAILHQLVTGEVRHQGDALHAVLMRAYTSVPHVYGPQVPEELATICNRACARSPQDRYESVEALREAIATYRVHRQAETLLEAARAHVMELEHILNEAVKSGAGAIKAPRMIEVHALVGACRFALEQAQQITSTPDRITPLKERLLHTLVSLEVRNKNVAAARAHAQELGENLSDRARGELDELEEEILAASQRLESLEELERSVDFGVSRKRKGLLAFVLAVIWGVAAFFAGDVVGSAGEEGMSMHMRGIVYKLIVSALIFIVWLIAKRLIVPTMLNRRLLNVVPIILLGGFVARPLAMLYGLSLNQATSLEMFSYGILAAVVGSFLDRWFFAIAIVYLCGTLLIAYLDAYAYLILGSSNVLTLSMVSFRWYTGKGSWAVNER